MKHRSQRSRFLSQVSQGQAEKEQSGHSGSRQREGHEQDREKRKAHSAYSQIDPVRNLACVLGQMGSHKWIRNEF